MILTFIGTTELLLIGGLALLLVGGKKLPEMMRGLGKGVREFKDGMNGLSSPENGETVKTNEPHSNIPAEDSNPKEIGNSNDSE